MQPLQRRKSIKRCKGMIKTKFSIEITFGPEEGYAIREDT